MVVLDLRSDPGDTVVRVDDRHHLVRQAAVIVFVPHHDDRVVSVLPRLGRLDGTDQILHRDVTGLNHQIVISVLAIGPDFAGAAGVLVVALVGHDKGVHAAAGDRTDVGRPFKSGGVQLQIGPACLVMPVGRIVVDDAEIRAPHHLQIVRQARVPYTEIVGRQIGALRIGIDEGRIRVAKDLAVMVVLHHQRPATIGSVVAGAPRYRYRLELPSRDRPYARYSGPIGLSSRKNAEADFSVPVGLPGTIGRPSRPASSDSPAYSPFRNGSGASL